MDLILGNLSHMTSGGSTLVENSSHHPKVEGSSLAAVADTEREIIMKKMRLT
jgi:hypothetical protein